MRNGVTADALRKGGSTFHIIFGLNLPQLSEIARSIGYDKELALKLWGNTSTRCSLLLATMIINPNDFSQAEAEKWISEVTDYEVADILCLKLLSKTDYSYILIKKYIDSSKLMSRYIAWRLLFTFLKRNPQYMEVWSKEINETAANSIDSKIRNIALQILMTLA